MIKNLRKILMIVLAFSFIFLIGCNNGEDPEKEFLVLLSEAKSFYAEGIMESFYTEGRKQNEFKVYYKNDNAVKVVLNNVESKDNQTILKNKDGVYILIPKINKNFRIQSEWPTNASYPYLLTSLAKDITNAKTPIITEDESTKTIETETYLYKDAVANKQKIVIDKKTALPKEVLIYDKSSALYIRVVFTEIVLDKDINDSEFVVNDTMTTLRSQQEDTVFENRTIKYPYYCPAECTLSLEKTKSSPDNLEVSSIMVYSGAYGFTIIQEYVNDTETVKFAQESGDVIFVLGVATLVKPTGLFAISDGVEYTIASTDLPIEEMIRILESYLQTEVEK